MKSVNAKRIAALAASVALGLTMAAPVSFSNIPIVNSAGQPVVQIVVGSSAQPSDGVVAANIAAVIGNLAFTSTPVTATVGGTSGLSCAITAASACSVSNQQVWLGEKGTVTAVGSYSFKTVIGSILNAAVLNYNTLNGTKTLQGSGSNTYPKYSSPYPQVSSPTATSAFAGLSISLTGTPQANVNGGGVTLSQITDTVSGSQYDNIVRFSNAQVPGLLNNNGQYGESEYLWALGFPVYDQASGVNNFAVLDAQSAYQVTFANPPKLFTGSPLVVNHASFTFDGANWTVFNATLPGATQPFSSNFITGGKLQLAQASTGLKTIYVGQNVSAGKITVTLQDLSYPNSNGVADAALAVYNNGVLTNETSVAPGATQLVNSTGTNVYLYVSQTFPGLYSYQKWAKVQLFSSVANVTQGKVFNNNPNWYASIWWTSNQSSSSNADTWTAGTDNANAELYGLVLYSNQSKTTTLSPGSTLAIGSSHKLTFAGDSLGTPGSGNSNYDPLTFSTSDSSLLSYTNPAETSVNTFTNTTVSAIGVTGSGGSNGASNATVISEPVNLLTVTSSSNSAFDLNGGSSLPSPSGAVSTVEYNLNPYQFVPSNTVDHAGVANILAAGNGGVNVIVTNSGLVSGNYVSSNYPLTVTVSGHVPGTSSVSSQTFSFTGFGSQALNGFAFGNVTNVQLSYAVPNGITVQVYDTFNSVLASPGSNSVLMGTLSPSAHPTLLYQVPQYSYWIAPNALTSSSVLYTLEGTNLPFKLGVNAAVANSGNQEFFTYTVPEIVLPSSTTAQANVVIGLYNSTTFEGNPAYFLNSTTSYTNAVNYESSQNNVVKAQAGFRTERGSEIASIAPTTLTYDMAKSVDTLQFLVGPQSSNVTSTTTNYGPYGVGQATNIPNVTIAKVNATCSFNSAAAASSCTVSGTGNLTATPSVKSAQQSVGLNTALTPLAVLDTNANNASTLIVVGSYYVNSVAQQIFAQNPSFASSFGTSSVVVQAFGTNRILVAGYSANQTVQAGNQFIQDLLSAAAATNSTK